MSNNKYDWSKLDNELINGYEKDGSFVNKFCSKYGIDGSTVRARLKILGIKVKSRGTERKKGKNSPNWRGGSYIENGYVMIYVSPGKYVPEHILVMEKKLGRKLLPHEIVHHIDESFEARSNNDEGNLELTNRSDHSYHHNKGKGKGYSIYFNKYYGKWQLEIRSKVTGKWLGAGVYLTKEDGLKAVDEQGYVLCHKE